MKKILFLITILVVGAALYKAYDKHTALQVKIYAEETPAPDIALEEAKKQVKDAGYILFAYGDGWDTYGKKVCNVLMKDPGVIAAAGEAIIMHYPIHQALSKEEQDARNEQWKGIKLPNADSYPALYLLDRNGKHYSTICGTFMRQADPTKVASLITERMDAKRKQDDLMAQAAQAQGEEKARLIGQACLIENINRPNGFEKQMKAADADDKSGLTRRVTFNPWAFVEKKLKEEPATVLAELDSMLADSAYSDEQKQVFCTCAIGTIRRNNLPNANERMKHYAELLKKYGSDTVLGKSADIALREWIVTLNINDGWQPAVIPADNTPVELLGKLPINQAGTYTVTFEYKKGNHALRVTAVELYDGDTKVAEDRHVGSAGRKSNKNTYDLKVDKDVQQPRIFITFDMGENRNSHGRISIFRQK